MAKAILVSPKDNVAVAVEAAKKGEDLVVEGQGEPIVLTALTDVPIYHKFALIDFKKDDSVLKYGEEIGLATEDIPKGSHVHVHNVNSRSLL